MERSALIAVARQLLAGQISPEQFADQARGAAPPAPSAQLADATLDLDRRRRCGFPEVVFGEGKTAESLGQILATLSARGEEVLATRIAPEIAARIAESLPAATYNPAARTLRLRLAAEKPAEDPAQRPWVAVITAGTSDLPVAEEARETLEWMGVRVTMIHDVGVAGPHRLPSRLAEFEQADAIVVVAGMEGALPSVVGGFVACPVIAVPTSVGYGASFGGVAALLSMLNSCASNVAVVNIDAGFKAAYLAGMIATRRYQAPSASSAE